MHFADHIVELTCFIKIYFLFKLFFFIFLIGDVAVRTCDGDYRLYGRQSTDIIKSSGYKISALEIEREILCHPQVRNKENQQL